MDRPVAVPVDEAVLGGDLGLPPGARGLVVLTRGRGSSRASPMNRYVARRLRADGFAALLFDLLTTEEEAEPRTAGEIPLLAMRLVGVTDWLGTRSDTRLLPVGYFAVDVAAAAALVAAAARPHLVRAVVACGGRPDLVAAAVRDVRAPTLLIVASDDQHLLALNRATATAMRGKGRLEVVPDTGPGPERDAAERVAALTRAWFEDHLAVAGGRRAG